jgi:hypothetical protein
MAGGIVGLLYVTGYYINLIFIRNLGITHSELLRLEYVSIGFTFTLITMGMVFLPFATFALTYRVRRASKLFHLHIGAIGNSLNTTLFLGFPLFLAFFATKYEMDLQLALPIIGLQRVSGAVLAFVVLTAAGTILVPVLERAITYRSSELWTRRLYRLGVEPIRYGIVLTAGYLMVRALSAFGWIGTFLRSGVYYFLVGAGLVAGLVAATLWIRKIRAVRGMWLVYGLIAFGLAAVYYFAVTSYVQAIYLFVPGNRGGRLPLTRAYVVVSGGNTLGTSAVQWGETKLRGPVYVIEETDDTMFVASERMERWLFEFVPIHALRKDTVPYARFERITDGFPRVTRPNGDARPGGAVSRPRGDPGR